MQRIRRMWPLLRGALLVAVVTVAVLVGAGCQRFDAAEPLREGIDDQFIEVQSSTDAFLQWCADEFTGNPDSWGP